MKIVLDTNVLVSALIRPDSVPSRVLDLILTRQATLVLDHRVFNKYQDVLYRPEFDLPRDQLDELLKFLWRHSDHVQAAAMRVYLPDPDDVMFIQVAVSAMADALVTGNLKHFPASERHGIPVLSPRQWLEMWAGSHRF